MIPILHEKTDTTFSNNGLGGLADCISANVVEERNGAYELELLYPVDGVHYDDIQIDRIIKAKANARSQNLQAFRIYNISKPINGKITVNAEHVSYQLKHMPLMPFTASTPSNFWTNVVKKCSVTNPFSFMTDKSTAISFKLTKPQALYDCLLGTEGSILDLCGSGDFEWDNYSIRYFTNRGQDNGVCIVYGKNLKDLTQEQNIEDTISAVVPYWQKDDVTVTLTAKIVSLSTNPYAYQRAVPLDLTSEFEEKPTETQLQAAAQNYLSKAQTTPKVNLTVDFVSLGDTLDYPELKGLETVGMCDTVTVEFEKLGVSATARVIKTDYDVLAEKYNKIEIGNAKNKISNTITTAAGAATQSQVNDIVKTQTDSIRGVNDSYIMWDKDDEGRQRLLFMDNPDKLQAVNVLQINQSGIGFSHTGINGTYTSAWTLDGHFNTDFINAELLRGVSIKITGGEVAINSDSKSKNIIKLNYGNDLSSAMKPKGFTVSLANGAGVDVGLGSDGSVIRGTILISGSDGKMMSIGNNGILNGGTIRCEDVIIDNQSVKSKLGI